jgi:phosphate transport system substrate-binding protein
MKKLTTFIILLAMLFSARHGSAQQPIHNKVIITGTRFTYPVVEKWVTEFKKTHPNVAIALAPLGTPAADSANVKIVSHDIAPSDLKAGDTYVALAKYGLLTIANAKSPLVPYYQNKGLQEADVDKLFFTTTPGTFKNYVVYTRQQESCAPTTFASQHGHTFADLSGTKISGDDKALFNAMKKDSLGISYNNLGYVYDIQTRKLNAGIAILPVDLNRNGKIDADEQFYNTLDDVIRKFETTSNPLLSVEDVNFVYAKNTSNPDITVFLNWVLTEGQKYNHEIGFLNFNSEELNKQKLALVK